jgi:hypothetical protein
MAALSALAMVAVAGCGSRVTDRVEAQRNPTLAPSGPGTSVPASTTSVAASTTTAAPTTTIDVAAATAAITANWERFFDAGTPILEREALLENGSSFEQALVMRSADPLQAQASAKVSSVTITDATHADVVYDVLLSGNPALQGSQGVAVLQDGVWKVSSDSFCSLVTLGASAPVPGCT